MRLVPPGQELVGAAVTPFHGKSPLDCQNRACPSLPPHYLIGAELRLADHAPLELNCGSAALSFIGDAGGPEQEKLFSSVVACGPVDEAKRQYAELTYRGVDETHGAVNLYDYAGVFQGGGGGIPSCSYQEEVALPFSFYVTRSDHHGHPVRELREVFRSEDTGIGPGRVNLLITVHSFADVTVERVDGEPCQIDH